MLEAFYPTEKGSLQEATVRGAFDLHDDLVWVDLLSPDEEEEQWLIDAYNITLPTLRSLEDISASARIYRDDDGVLHISTFFLSKNRPSEDEDELGSQILVDAHTVAFILHKNRLYTLRGQKLVSFRAFRVRAHRNDYDMDYHDPLWILLGLLEAKLDELADILEDVHRFLEVCTKEVLNNHHREAVLDLDDMVTRLAQQDDILGKAQLCLMDLRRVLNFLSRPRALSSHIYDVDVRELNEDVRSLTEHNAFLFQKVRFLLDTTSGFINTEQSDVIKRYSIITTMLAPPMLITSMYGMNIQYLPFSTTGTNSFLILCVLIVISFVCTVAYFRAKGWL